VVASQCVDHIVPHKGDERLFWEPTNHQPLCLPCNSAKAVREEGGFGNPRRSPALAVEPEQDRKRKQLPWRGRDRGEGG
jgi:5-methylcytosine-specific restriction endonuclease McrA